MLLLALILAAQIPNGIRVSVEPAVPCALDTRVPTALAHFVPDIGVEIGSIAGEGILVLHLREDGSDSKLELIDGRGRKVLERAIPHPKAIEGCPAMADAIALIVERYLADLGYQPGAASLPVLPPPPPTPAPPTRSSTPTRTSTAPTEIHLETRLLVNGVLGERVGQVESRVAPEIEVGVAYGVVRAELSAAFLSPVYRPFVRTDGLTLGSVRLWSTELSAGLGVCIGRLARLCPILKGGVAAIFSYPEGGRFFGRRNAAIFEPIIGASARFEIAISQTFSMLLDAGAIERPVRPKLDIPDATPTYTYANPETTLTFGAGLLMRIL
jgi:hypothetical protein